MLPLGHHSGLTCVTLVSLTVLTHSIVTSHQPMDSLTLSPTSLPTLTHCTSWNTHLASHFSLVHIHSVHFSHPLTRTHSLKHELTRTHFTLLPVRLDPPKSLPMVTLMVHTHSLGYTLRDSLIRRSDSEL